MSFATFLIFGPIGNGHPGLVDLQQMCHIVLSKICGPLAPLFIECYILQPTRVN